MFLSRKGLSHEFKSAGDGLWGLAADVSIRFTQIDVNVCEWEDGYCIEIIARHDLPFVDEGSYGMLLNTHQTANGLLYTDSGANNALLDVLRADPFLSKVIDVNNVDGSEQGMQQEDGYSCDANLTVELADFKVLANKLSENDDTLVVINE